MRWLKNTICQYRGWDVLWVAHPEPNMPLHKSAFTVLYLSYCGFLLLQLNSVPPDRKECDYTSHTSTSTTDYLSLDFNLLLPVSPVCSMQSSTPTLKSCGLCLVPGNLEEQRWEYFLYARVFWQRRKRVGSRRHFSYAKKCYWAYWMAAVVSMQPAVVQTWFELWSCTGF